MSSFFKNLFGSKSSSVIFVHTDKSRYFTGDFVEGTVSLSVYEPMHVDAINLKFKGFEQTKLIERRTSTVTINGRTQTHSYTVPHDEKRIIFRRIINLHNFKTTFNPGMYVFPFKFKLDDNIPGSFSISDSDAFGEITYKLKAEVLRPGILQCNVKHTQIIHVSPVFNQVIQRIQASKEENVTRFCCIDMGTVQLSAILEKNAYTAGDIAKLIIAIDNTSSDVTFNHIAFSLINSVNLKAGSYSKSVSKQQCQNQAPSIPKGETAHVTFSLNLPKVLSPTTVGSLIGSHYTLVVVMSVPCSPDVTLSLPVTIFAQGPENYIDKVEYPFDRPPKYEQAIDIKSDMFKVY